MDCWSVIGPTEARILARPGSAVDSHDSFCLLLSHANRQQALGLSARSPGIAGRLGRQSSGLLGWEGESHVVWGARKTPLGGRYETPEALGQSGRCDYRCCVYLLRAG